MWKTTSLTRSLKMHKPNKPSRQHSGQFPYLQSQECRLDENMSEDVKAYLHVVYAGAGDASILEFESGGKRRFYLVDGGPVHHVGAGGTLEGRIKELTKEQLTRPYYQYLLYTLTNLASVPNSKGKEITLDGAVVTHPHADHLEGVERLFRELLPDKYQVKVSPDNPTKRLMCNGPVLLTRKFALQTKAYRSFSEFLLRTKFEVSLVEEDIQNAFGGNDIVFSFPSSQGVLYQRHQHSVEGQPSEDEQRKKLEGEDVDRDLNKSSIILSTQAGGKICLTGDAFGHDIVALLRKQRMNDLDIFKLPHHGSKENCILETVLPPTWCKRNLALMLLLSISLRQARIKFENYPDEEDDIEHLRQRLKKTTARGGNGEEVGVVADTLLALLQEMMKNAQENISPESLFNKMREKHIDIVKAIQHQSGKRDLWSTLKPLNHLADKEWKKMVDTIAHRLPHCEPLNVSKHPSKKPKLDTRNKTLIKKLMGNAEMFRNYFEAKIGIDRFFESFHAKTYYVSARGRYTHPSPLVIKGIIKAAVKKKKPCRIVFTSGTGVPVNLPDVDSTHYQGWKNLVSMYYLRGDVAFKLDPSEDIHKVPSGTTKLTPADEEERSNVAEQLEKNFGFTIPQRTFLPELDKYYVTTSVSGKTLWLEVKGDGTFFLASTKSALTVSNEPSRYGDLRMVALKSDNGVEKNVLLEKEKKQGFLIKESGREGYLLVEEKSLKIIEGKNKGSVFSFHRKTVIIDSKSGEQIALVEFLKVFGYKDEGKSILVRGVLEVFLGIPNIRTLVEQLPGDFIAITTLEQEVDVKVSSVALAVSGECEVASSRIQVSLPAIPIKFDSSDVTKLEVLVKDPDSHTPSLSLLISTTLPDTDFTVNLSKHLQARKPSVDMYLNALGGVKTEGRENLTLGTLLDRVTGRLPLEALANCFPTQLFGGEIFTWKVDRCISTVDYFVSPLDVEVLSGDFYLIIPPNLTQITFGDTLIANMSRIHVLVSDPRTYKSKFEIDCAASIADVPVNMKMTCSPTGLPEVIISFPEETDYTVVFKTLDQAGNIPELMVPFARDAVKNLPLSKPRISVVQDVEGSSATRISSLSFDFPFDKFPSVLPLSLSPSEANKASVTIFDPISREPQVGFEVQFKLPVSTSSAEKSLLHSKFTLRPIQVSNQESKQGYICGVSLSPISSGITIQSALNAIMPEDVTNSMLSSVPFISSLLTSVLLEQVALEANPESRVIDSLTVSLLVPEFTIVEGKLSIYDANLFLGYANNQWYAEAETKLFAFNKFECQAEFTLPRAGGPGSLTFQTTEDEFTFKEFIEGIGLDIPEDIPIINEFFYVKVAKVAITCESEGNSLKLTNFVIVVEKTTLDVGIIKLYNLQIEVAYENVNDVSSVSFSLQGYLNPWTYASFAYNAETRELIGEYQLTENVSTSDCLGYLFSEETETFHGGSAFDQVKSLHVQEVEVVVSIPRDQRWSLKKFVLSIEGSLSLGPFNLHKLQFEYNKLQAENITRHFSVTGHFKSDGQSQSFVMTFSCVNQPSQKTTFEASIKPDDSGGITLPSLLKLIEVENPAVPDVDGSPNFLEIELKEAFLQFEVPFRIRKVDVVVESKTTMDFLETPCVQLHEARLEYHLDQTEVPAQTQVFIAGSFVIASCCLEVRLKKDTKRGLALEGRLDHASQVVDFEQAAKQLSPGLAVILPENTSVSLTSFVFMVEKSEESITLKLEGVAQETWSKDAGFRKIIVKGLGGKLNFQKERATDKWSGSICLTGEVELQSVDVDVEIYHDSKLGTIIFGTVQRPEEVDLEQMTQSLAVGSDSSSSWNDLVPKDTEASVRTPRYNSASVYVNFTDKVLLIYGSIEGFGTGALLIKKKSVKEETSGYGFFFGLSLGSEFRFSSINKSLGAVDEIISVQHAKLSVLSMDNVSVEVLCDTFSKLKELKGSSIIKTLDFEAPFSDLDITSISKLDVSLRGVTAYAKIDFSGQKSKLLSNVKQIQRDGKFPDVVLFAHMTETIDDTRFMAQIGLIELFGGSLSFHDVTLLYKPFVKKSFSLNGKMSVLLTDDSTPLDFLGSLDISESKAEFSVIAGGGPEVIHEPFGGMFGISFKQPELKVTWQFDEDQNKPIVPVYSISGTVNFFKSSSTEEKEPAVTLEGLILFQGGRPIVATISLHLEHPLSIDDVFVTLFKDDWPKGYLDVKFTGGEIYYCASPTAEIEEGRKKKTYKQGYRGETHIEIFEYSFGVEVAVDSNGMSIKGYTEREIDLKFVTLTQPEESDKERRGPEIAISRHDLRTEFKMSAGIKLFQEKIGTWSVSYSTRERCFLGSVKYHGKLLGMENPWIEFEWSKENGFRIRQLPAMLDLQEFVDFAKGFEELSKVDNSPCEVLVGLMFDKVIQTKCTLKIRQVPVKHSESPDAWFAFELQGSLDIMIVVTDKPSMTVDFPNMVITVDKPPNQFRLSDLAGFLIKEIGKNYLEVVKQVFSQPEQLSKFFSAYGTIELTRKLISGLICRGTESPRVTELAEKELKDMWDEARTKENTLTNDLNDFLESLDSLSSIIQRAAMAVKIIALALIVAALFAGIVKFIKGIIRFFTGKSKEQREAEEREEAAKKKAEQARKSVEDLLVVTNLSITLPKPDEIAVTWTPLEEKIKYRVQVKCVDLGGNEIILEDTTVESNSVNIKDDAVKYNAKKLTVIVQALYVCGNETFKGKTQSSSINAVPRLRAPSKVKADSMQSGRELHVTFSQVKYAQDYRAEIVAKDGSIIGNAIIDPSSESKDGTHVFLANKLASGVPGIITARVCARGAQEGDSDFSYSNGLDRVASPTNIRHCFRSVSQDLLVEWKVADARNISRFLCEMRSVKENIVVYATHVENPNYDKYESTLSVPMRAISEKLNSPYQISVCSLGSSAALASTIAHSYDQVSFLQQAQGISLYYDVETNKLTVSWKLVTGATKYRVTIKENSGTSTDTANLIVDGNRNSVVFEMVNVALKVGIKYIVSVVAEGSDSQHLPSEPSSPSTEITRLPSPVSTIQGYYFEEKQIKVTFQPVCDAFPHAIEVFNEKYPSQIVARQVVPKSNTQVAFSFDISDMTFSGDARFKARVFALGNVNFLNSVPCVTATALTCSKAVTSVKLEYCAESEKLTVTFSSQSGNFIAKLEDICHEDRTIITQSVPVPVSRSSNENESHSVRQSVLDVAIHTRKEPRGAAYRASVQNTGNRQNLPSEIKQSNEVPLLDPPDIVTQECKDGVFTVAWTCVQSAAGYYIRVYNSKTKRIATETSIDLDLRHAGEQMKKEFNVELLSLESSGLYKTSVKVLGNEISIGGASTKSATKISSCSSPQDVKISFNNDARLMHVSCSPVTGAAVFNLGVVDASILRNQNKKIQDAILGLSPVICSSGDLVRPVTVEFDDSALTSPFDDQYKGVARMMSLQGDATCLPSPYSISEDVVSWLRPAVPIHMSFDPVKTSLKITWNSVELALKYLVEVLQTKTGEMTSTKKESTLIPFSKEVDVLSCDVNMKVVAIDQNDTFIAKVQPIGIPGKVITEHSIGYSTDILVCEDSPKQLEVLQVENELVKLRWQEDATREFQIKVCKLLHSEIQEDVISEYIKKPEFEATAVSLRMVTPGQYKFGVRTLGSTKTLHSVYTETDFLAVIMDSPVVKVMRQCPAVTVQWTPVDNNPTQDFSNYVISYRQEDPGLPWQLLEVELSATEKTIGGLQADSEYTFCVSVASFQRGKGIRSPSITIHTSAEHVISGNLLDNPNFEPAADDWDRSGHTWNIVTHPWMIIQPKDMQYRLEKISPGTKRFFKDESFNWCVQASRACCWRVQIIDLLAKGLSPEYLDQVKPDIQVSEWFTVKMGHKGIYSMKVSLLDCDKKDIPGRNFYCSALLPPLFTTVSLSSAETWKWDCLGHTFSDYPSGLRFIRFEDTMQSGTSFPTSLPKEWRNKLSIPEVLPYYGAGTDIYDVQAFGATVKISKSSISHDDKFQCSQNYSEECEEGINKQINLELYASNVFLILSALYDVPLYDIMLQESDKGRERAQMLMQYQKNRGGDILLDDVEKWEPGRWGDELEACGIAIGMSGDIVQALVDLHRVAKENDDSHMVEFVFDRLICKRGEYSDLYTKLKVYCLDHEAKR